jgi:acetoin utilization deacetylase AcuC-like enzyme
MKIFYHPIYAHPLPENHRFPMAKYELIPAQLLHEGTLEANQIIAPGTCPDEWITAVHTTEYLHKLNTLSLTASEQRSIGFPQSAELIQREKMITQGTVDACHWAMKAGVSLNVAGGTHHAFADRGEGFCLINDMAVAAAYLLRENLAGQILIIDLDVHQGNGTASIFREEPRVFTLSMHGAHNYPFRKEISDLDIPLKDGTTGETYLSLLHQHLPEVLDRHQPDFAFYLSGVDVLATDRFGKLKLSMEDCLERDRYVFLQLQKRGIPVTVAMGGGYSPQLSTIVEAHCNIFRIARNIYG